MAKILLVDDDVDLVEMYTAVLAHRGHEVEGAYSAKEALEAVSDEGAPDIFVLDVMMESQTAGFQLARDLHERFPSTPAIMLTGIHAASGVPFRFAPEKDWLPVVVFLDKPVTAAALVDTIDEVLEKERGAK